MRAMTRDSNARWAVYFVPEPDELLGTLGQAWFAAHDRAAYLASPMRYGFHATLKAPFRLRDDATADGLRLSARRLAKRLDAVAVEGLEVVAMGRYLALMPERPCPTVAALARRLHREEEEAVRSSRMRAALTTFSALLVPNEAQKLSRKLASASA